MARLKEHKFPLHQRRSVAFNCAKLHLQPRLRGVSNPAGAGGANDAPQRLRDHLVGWGGEYPSSFSIPRPRRLRRLSSGAFAPLSSDIPTSKTLALPLNLTITSYRKHKFVSNSFTRWFAICSNAKQQN